MLAEIEQAIATQLATLEDLDCRVLNSPNPGRPNMKAELLIFYSGRSLVQSGGGRQRQYNLQFTCNIFVKDLRSHHVAYPILERAAELLDGFRPLGPEQGRLTLQGEDYQIVETSQGFRWHYEQSFSMSALWAARQQ
jgi:hypothetical protein